MKVKKKKKNAKPEGIKKQMKEKQNKIHKEKKWKVERKKKQA